MNLQKNKVGRKAKPILKIGVDCGAISGHSNNYSGLFTITQKLLEKLTTIDKRNSYLLFSFTRLKTNFEGSNSEFKNIVVWPRIAFKTISLPIFLNLYKPDIFLALNQALPQTRIPSLGFVYDLAFLKYPQFYPNFAKLKTNTEKLIQSAKHLITISYASKTEIVNTYGVDDERISVLYPGVDSSFTPSGAKFIDTLPYFLYVGGFRKSKNIPTLLKAFFMFLKDFNSSAKLVLIGGGEINDPEIKITINRLSLHKYVVIKNNVNETDLPKYYRGAYAFVTPTWYEGFCLPLIESMACGTPVIASYNSAIKEIVNNHALLIPPNDPKEIYKNLTNMWLNKKLYLKLSNSGLKYSRKFTWDKFSYGVLKSIYKYCLK